MKTITTKSSERIRISISYTNDDVEDETKYEHLYHVVEFNRVPDQNRVWERTKEMVDSLYRQVR